MIHEAVVVSAARTGCGVFGGTLSNIPAPQLGGIAAKAALERAGLKGDVIDEVIIGTHFQAGIKANSARQASLAAGFPDTVPAWTPNKNCGTALRAIHCAAESIMLGHNDIVVSGGCECMSSIPYVLNKARFGYRMGNEQILDSMIYDGLVDPFMNYHMGITGENVAEKCGITREMQDELAYRSHANASRAEKDGLTKEAIVPVEIKTKKGVVMYDKDETIRHDLTMEQLQKMKPFFKKDGTVTVGNASPVNDQGAAIVVMSRAKANELGLKARCKITAFTAAALHPSIMGYAPVPACEKLLKRAGLKIEDIDIWELNEAFAAQACACIQDLKIDPAKVNVNGGAIALGHPVGATGARLLMTAMFELERRQAKRAIISMCIGGGQGIATLIERD